MAFFTEGWKKPVQTIEAHMPLEDVYAQFLSVVRVYKGYDYDQEYPVRKQEKMAYSGQLLAQLFVTLRQLGFWSLV